MGNYSEDSNSVRVDFHNRDDRGNVVLIHDYFKQLLVETLELAGRVRHAGYWAICLEPYHETFCPIMVKVPGCYGCRLLVCVTPGKCNRDLHL
jgi:hypothetical protein